MTASIKASAGIVIDRPIETVFAFTANVANMDKWVEGVSEPRQTSAGDYGVGATLASKYIYAGKTHDIGYEVTAFDPPHRHRMKSTEGPFPFEGTVEFEPADEGKTRVTNTIEAGSDHVITSLMFRFLPPLMRYFMRKQLKKELERLKTAIEGQT